jgi:hypothetical protein
MSNPFHDTEAPTPPGWVRELLTSGFFWLTLILLSHALVATGFGGFEWRLAAWLLFSVHVFSYVGMCLFFAAVLGSATSVLPRK